VIVRKVRICELQVGDSFEMNGVRWKVRQKMDGVIVFARLRLMYGRLWKYGGEIESRGSRSQQFVNLIKRDHEQITGVVDGDKKAEGPAN
jgi:hypothetical protein